MKTMGMICLLAAAPLLRADGLADIRASLAKFTARDAVRAAVSVDTHSRSDDGDAPESGKATFEAEHGAQGLRLTWAPDVVSRAQQEARANANDPDTPTPTRNAMRQVDPEELIEVLDAARAMTRRLENAKLVKDQRIANGGRAVRQLTLSLHPKLSKADAKRVKTFELGLVVNLDADGVPLSAELRQTLKAKFLLMSFHQEQQESWTFARTGDRLVALRHHERATGSGMGQKFENSTLMTLALK